MYFQDLILTLQKFWAKRGCLIVQPYNSEVGAGTYNPATFLRALGPEPWNVAFVEPSRRPTDGRYGDNPNRLQQFHQFQVILKPCPLDIQDLYLESLRAIGTKPLEHDVRFIEDDWESPTLGAWGLGWQVWLDGLEISQFTYFQQVGGIDCRPVAGELTYGLERIAMYLQDVDTIYDLECDARVSYGEIYKRAEWEWSTYNFEQADVAAHFAAFDQYEAEAKRLLARDEDPLEEARAPRVRLRRQGRAPVQRARRARRDRRHRAPALHRARARAGAHRRRGVPRAARSARLSLARASQQSRGVAPRGAVSRSAGRRTPCRRAPPWSPQASMPQSRTRGSPDSRTCDL